jgi:predicted RNase H-like nuclease
MGERKAFEDTLDAVICAWVAVRALEGLAVPFGDDTAAIWIPMRRR